MNCISHINYKKLCKPNRNLFSITSRWINRKQLNQQILLISQKIHSTIQ